MVQKVVALSTESMYRFVSQGVKELWYWAMILFMIASFRLNISLQKYMGFYNYVFVDKGVISDFVRVCDLFQLWFLARCTRFQECWTPHSWRSSYSWSILSKQSAIHSSTTDFLGIMQTHELSSFHQNKITLNPGLISLHGTWQHWLGTPLPKNVFKCSKNFPWNLEKNYSTE